MKLLLLLALIITCSFATDNFLNMKKCETIQLSKLTVLVSCHKIDYLIEYKVTEDEEKDRVKKITAITPNDQRVIKSIGK